MIPYSKAIKSGCYLFVAGHIGVEPKSNELSPDIEKQTKQLLENIKATLEYQGATLADVVKTTIFLKDMKDYAVVNEIYAKYFKEPYPARSTVQVSALPREALIEIECIAKVKEDYSGCRGCGEC